MVVSDHNRPVRRNEKRYLRYSDFTFIMQLTEKSYLRYPLSLKKSSSK